MEIIILNGPNLNLLGKREPEIYGDKSLESAMDEIRKQFPSVDIKSFQSNSESQLVSWIQDFGFSADGIILNAGAYTHTSVAIRDAISGIDSSVVEVHISNIHARESFRHNSLIAGVCKGSIQGFGLKSYALAVETFL